MATMIVMATMVAVAIAGVVEVDLQGEAEEVVGATEGDIEGPRFCFRRLWLSRDGIYFETFLRLRHSRIPSKSY
jgi:hypothetical protein